MENLSGRLLLASDLTEDELKLPHLKLPGMEEISKMEIRCNRCGASHFKKVVQLPIGAYYCPTCISLGRVRSDEYLYQFPAVEFPGGSYLRWSGRLSPIQQRISDQLVRETQQASKLWLHAVTGAGKTEMIYAMIDQALQAGKSVCLASPRLDVIYELHARLSKDFSCEIPLLYAEGDDYFESPLIIASSHQLLRFREAFDLLIIDEVDAFPFVGNPLFEQVLDTARKQESSLVYLTATAHPSLVKAVKKGELKKLEVSGRYHGRPLPVPKLFWQSHFMRLYKEQAKSGFPLLIFVPNLEMGEKLAKELGIPFVSSESSDRKERVEDFRKGRISALVSSTILERGVTFPKVDVFVYQADHFHFTSSVLVQMAGRAGRSPERPNGFVAFFHSGKTLAMIKAIKEIQYHNRKSHAHKI